MVHFKGFLISWVHFNGCSFCTTSGAQNTLKIAKEKIKRNRKQVFVELC